MISVHCDMNHIAEAVGSYLHRILILNSLPFESGLVSNISPDSKKAKSVLIFSCVEIDARHPIPNDLRGLAPRHLLDLFQWRQLTLTFYAHRYFTLI